MIITNANTYTVDAGWRNFVFLELETDEGIVGVGEITVGGLSDAVVPIAHGLVRRYAIGRDPFDIEALWTSMYRDEHWRGGAAVTTAISGIEIACWDIVGKSLGVPVHRLLGGRCHDRVRAYANGWYDGVEDPAKLKDHVQQVLDRGYDALKIDPFKTIANEISRVDLRQIADLVGRIRHLIGEDRYLFIEGHGRFTTSAAIRVGQALAEFSPDFFEEPVSQENIDAMKKVSDALPIPIATGERLFTRYGFAELIARQAVDIVQPDCIHAGGILEMKKIAAMADAHYIAVAPHNSCGPVAAAATLQFDATCPNLYMQEMFADFDAAWWFDLVDGAPRVKDGWIEISQRPGLGVSLNREELAKHPERQDAYFNMFSKGWEEGFFRVQDRGS